MKGITQAPTKAPLAQSFVLGALRRRVDSECFLASRLMKWMLPFLHARDVNDRLIFPAQ